jgi:hypothetical protein
MRDNQRIRHNHKRSGLESDRFGIEYEGFRPEQYRTVKEHEATRFDYQGTGLESESISMEHKGFGSEPS